jgi:hypothetical protein
MYIYMYIRAVHIRSMYITCMRVHIIYALYCMSPACADAAGAGRPVPAAALPPVVVELLKLMAAFSNYEVCWRILTYPDVS